MFSTELANNIGLTQEDILARATELDIYEAYLGKIKVGQIYNSPLRKDDNPSFGLYYSKRTGQLLFKDLGTGECGNVFKFVRLYTGFTSNEVNKDITQRLNLNHDTYYASSKHKIKPISTKIGVVRQPFTAADIAYWNQFNISVDTLHKFDVSSIKYYLSDDVIKWTYSEDNPMYVYKVYNHLKIYRPYANKRDKWRNNCTINDIQGYKQLPKNGDVCIITKSLKDVMCLYEMGIPAISPSSESSFISDIALERILKRFKHVFILYDRDVPGVKNMRLQSLKTDLRGILVHKRYKAKDVSDAVAKNGFETIKNWLHETLEKEKRRQDTKCNSN